MIQTKSNQHNGVKYRKIESSHKVECAMAFGGEKYVMSGYPSIEVMEKSYKYGDQTQITVYNKPGSIVKHLRVPYAWKYDRIEIFFPKEVFKEMCKQFLEGGERTTHQAQAFGNAAPHTSTHPDASETL